MNNMDERDVSQLTIKFPISTIVALNLKPIARVQQFTYSMTDFNTCFDVIKMYTKMQINQLG